MISLEREPISDGARRELAAKRRVSANELRHEHFAAVYAYVSRRIRPREDAEDVVQETFVAAFRELPKLKGDPRLWLYGIARRKVADVLRRRSRKRPAVSSESQSIQVDTEARMAAEVLRELVDGLPSGQRDALLLQSLEELSVAEIATVMGRSPKSVKELLARAKDTLRERGRSYFADEENY